MRLLTAPLIWATFLFVCVDSYAQLPKLPKLSASSIRNAERNKVVDFNQPIPFDSMAVKGTLENGLTYYIRPNSKPEKYAELRLVVNAGSILEDEDQQGLAHFLEHMAFNGTKNFPKNELVDYLESIGTKFGPHLNAYTSFDETVYILRVPTEPAEQFATGLQILEDWAHNLTFEGEEIEKERGVVIEEWRQGLGADERMRQETFPKTYYNSRYAKRLPIGKKEILEVFDHESLKRFYRDWYRPDLMAIVVVGDVDVAKTLQMIDEKFGKIPAPEEGVRERKLYPVPDHAETLVSLVTDEEARYNTVEYQVKHRHKELKTLADYRKSLTGQLASAMLQARLNEIRQQPQPPFSFSYMGYRPMSRTKDAFSMTAFVAEDKFMEGFRAIMVENERARRYGFTQTELERQKKSWMVSAEKSVKEADKVESTRLTWKFVRNYLSNTPAVSAEDRLKLGQLLMPIITLRDINQMYQSWQSTESQVVTMIGNGKAENMPEEAEILSFLKGLELMELAPYEDEAADKPLMAAKPAPGKIVGRKDISELGVTTLYLGNGIKAILKPTNFKNDEILMSAYSTGGSSLYPDQDFQSASYAAPITSSSGLGPYSNVQLQKYMSDKVASVRPYIGEIEEGFRGSCAPKDLELLFQMIHLYMTEPPRDDEAFRSFIAQQMAFMQNRFANPNVWFNNEVLKALYQNHPRRRIMGAEDLERTHPERVHTVFLERFSRPEGFTFVFVGNFEVEQMEQMLKKYLASVPAKGKTETFKNVNASPVSGQVKKEFRKGKEPKSAVSIHYTGKMDWSLRNRWHMNAMTMVLRIMLRESLREDLGGVYGVSVRASPSRFPVQAYDISISFQCAPENVPKLVTSVKQQIASLQSGGPSEANLQKVKETQRKSYEVGIKENRTWLSYLKFYDSNELDPMLLLSTLDRVDALTAGEVQNAAKRYLNGDNYFEAVLLPEETSDK